MYYHLLGFVGLAFGSLAAGQVISHLQSRTSTYLAYRSIFAVYAVLGLVKVLLCAFLTEETELWKSPRRSSTDSGSSVDGERQPLLSARPPIPSSVSTPHLKVPVVVVNEAPADEPQLAPASPSRLSLCLAVALFGIDAFASSLTPTSYIALFLQKLHHAPVSVISTVFAGGALCAVLFSLGTGALVKRIGLVLAMVTTHSETIPSTPCRNVRVLIRQPPSYSSSSNHNGRDRVRIHAPGRHLTHHRADVVVLNGLEYSRAFYGAWKSRPSISPVDTLSATGSAPRLDGSARSSHQTPRQYVPSGEKLARPV